MTDRTLTLEHAIDENSYEPGVREGLVSWFGDRTEVPVLAIFDDDFPLSRDWKVSRLLRDQIFSNRELHQLSCDFVERLVELWESAVGRPDCDQEYVKFFIETCFNGSGYKEALAVKRKWVRGEASDEELREAGARVAESNRKWFDVDRHASCGPLLMWCALWEDPWDSAAESARGAWLVICNTHDCRLPKWDEELDLCLSRLKYMVSQPREY